MAAAHILQTVHRALGWPSRDEIFSPRGAGPAVYARLANQKLADPIRHLEDARDVRAGVLVGNPESDQSDDPLGVVCEFSSPITDATLREAHKLAWSFSRSKVLVTAEPHQIRIWSCYERPNFDNEPFVLTPVTAPVTTSDLATKTSLDRVAELIHWARVASGQLVTRNPERFKEADRANKMLLANLRFIRRKLRAASLAESVAHDLLARLIFIQFLFQRKGRKGKPALHADLLHGLQRRGVLSQPHTSLPDILRSKKDTYSFFRWLDRRFNGDLFPDNWSQERKQVTPAHLQILSDFVRGDIRVEDGQRCLWPLYSFDAIPLEFVSSIYEEFVAGGDDDRTSLGEHYTRTELVDLVLDRVLPWKGNRYDLKILDPACGSGIFLVKAFQRLVHRWRASNRGKEPSASFLKGLLENNLFGVDLNERAVRVASFSLYLAMCDEKDPRHYWTTMRFPDLRNVTLRARDFFSEDVAGISTVDDANKYDIVVGNAPWGDSSLTPEARAWAARFSWDTSDEQSGLLFLPKAAALTRRGGRVAMIQSANSLMFNVGSTAIAVRKKLFESYKVHEIINLSMRRFEVFNEAVAPACIISFTPTKPDKAEPIAYWSPKTTPLLDAQNHMTMESHDLNWVYPLEAARDTFVWTALALGGRRDLELVRRLRTEGPSLRDAPGWRVDRGFQRGRSIPYLDRLEGTPLVAKRVRRKDPPERVARLLIEAVAENTSFASILLICYLEHADALLSLPAEQRKKVAKIVYLSSRLSEDDNDDLPVIDLIVMLGPAKAYEDRLHIPAIENKRPEWRDGLTILKASALVPNSNPVFEHPREMSSYSLPMALMTESWALDVFRFRCCVVEPDQSHQAALYSQSYYGIHAPTEEALASFAATVTSSLLVYYLYMTGGRLAAYRPTARKTEIEDVPIPLSANLSLGQLAGMSVTDIDDYAFQIFGLNIPERALVEDFFKFTLSDFKEGTSSVGREPVRHDEGDMTRYCDFFLRVLRVGFGGERAHGATIYRTPRGSPELGFCLVAIHFQLGRGTACAEELVDPDKLLQLFTDVDGLLRNQGGGSVFYQRVARVFAMAQVPGRAEEPHVVPTVYLIKPNQRRYWTRAIALRDADDVAVDVMTWTQSAGKGRRQCGTI